MEATIFHRGVGACVLVQSFEVLERPKPLVNLTKLKKR